MARRCKYGKLKHPRGGRRCRQAPARRKATRRRASRSGRSELKKYKRDVERDLAHEIAKSFGRHKRRR